MDDDRFVSLDTFRFISKQRGLSRYNIKDGLTKSELQQKEAEINQPAIPVTKELVN